MTWVHYLILAAFALGLGMSVGSFLNVCIWRLPRGESVIRPRSRCPNCGTPIRVRDNLPVLGWLMLGGRCRHCAWPIPARYPLVEASVGVLFAGVMLADLALDPLEYGDVGVLGVLAYHLVLVALLVTVTMIARDERAGVFLSPPCPRPLGLGALGLVMGVVALASAHATDLLGSALNTLLLAVFVLRLLPPRPMLGRLLVARAARSAPTPSRTTCPMRSSSRPATIGSEPGGQHLISLLEQGVSSRG